MKRIRIQNTENEFFPWAWELYKRSFPTEERRQLQIQRNVMEDARYFFEIIFSSVHAPLGILLWWKFEDLRYIEHFAIDHMVRNQGYGKELLKQYLAESSLSVILEVELPSDELKIRRINFYKRLGFIINPHLYFQPAYKKNGKMVKLLLATYPQKISEVEASQFCEKYHPIIHKLT